MANTFQRLALPAKLFMLKGRNLYNWKNQKENRLLRVHILILATRYLQEVTVACSDTFSKQRLIDLVGFSSLLKESMLFIIYSTRSLKILILKSTCN